MARAPKLLTILVHPSLMETEEVQELIDKGHEVTDMQYWSGERDPFLETYDLILSPNAWRILPSLPRMITEAVKAARAVRYPTKKKEAKAS